MIPILAISLCGCNSKTTKEQSSDIIYNGEHPVMSDSQFRSYLKRVSVTPDNWSEYFEFASYKDNIHADPDPLHPDDDAQILILKKEYYAQVKRCEIVLEHKNSHESYTCNVQETTNRTLTPLPIDSSISDYDCVSARGAIILIDIDSVPDVYLCEDSFYGSGKIIFVGDEFACAPYQLNSISTGNDLEDYLN